MPFGKMAKRLAALILAAALLLLTGCRPLVEGERALETQRVSATCYPVYALAVNIVKDVPALSLSCLMQPQDGCIRSYSLSDWDYSILMNQDAVIMGGRGLEGFEGALNQLTTGPVLISSLEGARLREETAGDSDDENTAHFLGENPWAFLSAAGAMEMSAAIAGGMAAADELFADRYYENLEEFMKRLDVLAADMNEIMAPARRSGVALLHEGLSYFAGQFGLDAVITWPREPGTDLVDNDLEALLQALSEAGAEVVFIEEQAPDHLARALEEAGYPVARIDTLTAHMADGDTGAYERIMLENAQAARRALDAAGS